jgi:hypothetical protein
MRRRAGGRRCGACGRGRTYPRSREASGRRPLQLRGAAFDGWTRRGRRRAKARRIWLAESRPGPRPEVTVPGTEKPRWSAGRRPHFGNGVRQDGRLVRRPVLHPLVLCEGERRGLWRTPRH